jgi:hypothetical protein
MQAMIRQLLGQPFTVPVIGRLVVRYADHKRQPLRKGP